MKLVGRKRLAPEPVYDIGLAGDHNFLTGNGKTSAVASNCFNKAHSICYALIAYQTAYLKHHYPGEFFASMMTVKSDRTDIMQDLVDIAQESGIEVLGPDINRSTVGFKADGDQILFGFGAIKGLGETALKAVLEAREKGDFNNIYDFVKRVHLGKCRSNNVLQLIYAGAFDGLVHTRAQLVHGYEDAIKKARQFQKDRRSGQLSLLNNFEKNDVTFFIPEVSRDPDQELMNEHEVLGLFLSGHPLDKYKGILEKKVTDRICTFEDLPVGKEVTIGGFLSRVTPRSISRGTMCFITLGDKTGVMDATLWPDTYKRYKDNLVEGAPVLIEGKVERYRGSNSMVVTGLANLDEMAEKVKRIEISVESTHHVRRLARITKRYEGDGAWLKVKCGSGWIMPMKVANPDELKKEVMRAMPTSEIKLAY